MDPDKKIKPAEIKDEELNEAQGGLRAFKHAGIRATILRCGHRPTPVSTNRTKW